MPDSLELNSRTIGDIDLRSSSAISTDDLERLLADPPPADEALAARLARVERLLDADLSALGPSVVTAAIADLTTRLDELAAKVDQIGTRWDQEEEPLDETLAIRVARRLDGIDKRIDRLILLVEAATAPEPAPAPSPTEVAIGKVNARLAQIGLEVARLAAAAEEGDAGS